MMDRQKMNRTCVQVTTITNFMDFVVSPLLHSVLNILPELEPFKDNLGKNRIKWLETREEPEEQKACQEQEEH